MDAEDRFRRPIQRSPGFDPVPAKPGLVDAKRRAAAEGKRLTGTPRQSRKNRLPPGQERVTTFPTLDLGSRPLVDPKSWTLTWGGLCGAPGTMDWRAFNDLGIVESVSDIHCVTGWSRFDNRWRGLPMTVLLKRARPVAEATHVIFKGHDGFGTALELRDQQRWRMHWWSMQR